MSSLIALSIRELKRFIRQKGRITGALVTPLMIWIILGQGIGDSFQVKGQEMKGYLEYFYPGILLMVLLFTSIFSMITLIEDRESGFLQSLWVSPVSNTSLIMGKVLGCSFIAVIQAILFLFLASFAQIDLSLISMLYLIILLFLIAIEISLLSYVVAWACDSTQAFHVWMNVLLMPLWLFSGAVFDMGQVPTWMYALMQINPLTYALSGTRQIIYAQDSDHLFNILLRSGSTAIAFAIIFFICAYALIRKNRN